MRAGDDTAFRWSATVYYRTDRGFADVTHDLADLGDLDGGMAHGPDWDTIEQIVITRHRPRARPDC